jgi:hypothetical protein
MSIGGRGLVPTPLKHTVKETPALFCIWRWCFDALTHNVSPFYCLDRVQNLHVLDRIV